MDMTECRESVSAAPGKHTHVVIDWTDHKLCYGQPETEVLLDKDTGLQTNGLRKMMKPHAFIVPVVLVMVALHATLEPRGRRLLQWVPAELVRQPWRALSYGLVHSDLEHLVSNCLLALLIGPVLEREQRWWRVGAVWVASLAGGALGVSLLRPAVTLVGCSAAVCALITSHVPNMFYKWGELKRAWVRALLVAAATAGALAHTALPAEHVSHEAHLVGAALGLPLGFLLYTGGEEGGGVPDSCARAVSGVLLLLGAGALVACQ